MPDDQVITLTQAAATPAYELDDAEVRHHAHPATFQIPDRDDREALRPGDLAKLIFLAPHGGDGFTGERMWVIVQRRLDDGGYVGEINNHPVIVDAEAGDIVRFNARHVIDVEFVDTPKAA